MTTRGTHTHTQAHKLTNVELVLTCVHTLVTCKFVAQLEEWLVNARLEGVLVQSEEANCRFVFVVPEKHSNLCQLPKILTALKQVIVLHDLT